MFKVFEIDYYNRVHSIGKAEDIKTACEIERKALRESNGEYPTFTTDGKKVYTHNGEIL